MQASLDMRVLLAAVAAGVMAGPCAASSVSIAVLLDGDEGRSLDLDGRLDLTPGWSIGAGAGRSELDLGGEQFSGTSLRAGTDVQIGALFAGASAERWKDSDQLRATTLRGELGWMSEAGLVIAALVADRSLKIDYTAIILGQPRQFDVNFQGTGFGGEVAWFGPVWSASLRYLDYSYGNNVARVRAVLQSANTERFPRVQRLAESVATRAAGAPDRELTLALGRQFTRSYLTADWGLQRDALTRENTRSYGLTLGVELGSRLVLDTMAGLSDGAESGSVAWGGLALTLRGAQRD